MARLPIYEESTETRALSLYRRALGLWAGHVSDEAVFGAAGVYANSRLSAIAEANCLIGEVAPSQAQPILDYYAQAQCRPLQWHLPAGELPGFKSEQIDVHRLNGAPAWISPTHPDLTIVPARASFPHVRQIAAQMRPGVPLDQAGEAAMSHLDDSRVDAILALHSGEAVGYGSVLSTGETGFVMDLFVSPEVRGRGYARALMGWIFDLCGRSLFHDVYCVPREGEGFARKMGFAAVAQTTLRVREI